MYISTYERVSRQAERTPAGSKIGLNTHNFQTVTVDIVLLILTTFFVGLRLYSRKLQGLKYGAEDWSILGALVGIYILPVGTQLISGEGSFLLLYRSLVCSDIRRGHWIPCKSIICRANKIIPHSTSLMDHPSSDLD